MLSSGGLPQGLENVEAQGICYRDQRMFVFRGSVSGTKECWGSGGSDSRTRKYWGLGGLTRTRECWGHWRNQSQGFETMRKTGEFISGTRNCWGPGTWGAGPSCRGITLQFLISLLLWPGGLLQGPCYLCPYDAEESS